MNSLNILLQQLLLRMVHFPKVSNVSQLRLWEMLWNQFLFLNAVKLHSNSVIYGRPDFKQFCEAILLLQHLIKSFWKWFVKLHSDANELDFALLSFGVSPCCCVAKTTLLTMSTLGYFAVFWISPITNVIE